MTTEEILRQQIAELEKLVKLKDERIIELIQSKNKWSFQTYPPYKPYKLDAPYWDYTKIYCGNSTEGVTVTTNDLGQTIKTV